MDAPNERSGKTLQALTVLLAIASVTAVLATLAVLWFAPQWRAIQHDRAVAAHRSP